MTLQEASNLLKINKMNFGYLYKDFNAEDLKLLAANWATQLADVPVDIGNAAFMDAQRHSGNNPVTIGLLFESLRRLQESRQTPIAELWQLVIKNARKMANNQGGYSYTFKTNGKTQGQVMREENIKLYEALPQEIKSWVGGVSSMIELGKMGNSELEQFARPRFVKEVKALRHDTYLPQNDTQKIKASKKDILKDAMEKSLVYRPSNGAL